jgi:aryl-alcohol dehydrogenase-like predicted oxidoreductase
MPMARELGLGVTPWSPLKSGILSGKYTRQNAGSVKPDRRAWSAGFLHDKAYAVIDELQRIAGQLDTTVARVALAWVQGRPGVASTILGARTLPQLDDNLKALDLTLTAEQSAALDELTTPTLNFPAELLPLTRMLHAGGTTINGEKSQLLTAFGPSKPDDHY